jgi:hypothetical protein
MAETPRTSWTDVDLIRAILKNQERLDAGESVEPIVVAEIRDHFRTEETDG